MPWSSLKEVTLTNEFEDVAMVLTAAPSVNQSNYSLGDFKLCHRAPAELQCRDGDELNVSLNSTCFLKVRLACNFILFKFLTKVIDFGNLFVLCFTSLDRDGLVCQLANLNNKNN